MGLTYHDTIMKDGDGNIHYPRTDLASVHNSDGTKTAETIIAELQAADAQINTNLNWYVDNGFLTLVIGKNFASHFVGEWFRPMLIQIRLIRNAASLILNGEEVISLTIETDNLELTKEYSQ